jgi:prepilin-type N-terminal cleavage/methylation domain-containing protein
MQAAAGRVDVVRMEHDDGFTLVEIMVVMLILGMLAGIAIPSFLGQRDKAHAAAVATDLRSLQLAQGSRAVEGDYTESEALLRLSGLAISADVVHRVDVRPDHRSWIGCMTHPALEYWLTHDSATGVTERRLTPCVPD